MSEVRTRVRRTGVAVLMALGLTASSVVLAQPAAAAPSCTSGYVCMWTGQNGAGTKYQYAMQSNHTHRVASVHYNYNTLPISFWTANSGTGALITRYTLGERGFRNWSSSNWDRCRSHWDRY